MLYNDPQFGSLEDSRIMKRQLSLVLLAAFATLTAQDHGSITSNPYSSPEDRQAGMNLFRTTCAACHGLEGTGGAHGPSLTTGAFKHGGSDAALFRTITQGVRDTPMAAFPLPGPDIWRLIAYIRSVNVGRGVQQAKGDSARGAQVFAAQGCARCHRAEGAGGFIGPDLSQIGSLRSLAQLEDSILDPNAVVLPEYWSLRARTKSGESILAVRVNEDMDSFQVHDSSGRLRSLWKKDLVTWEIVHSSPMPSFKDKLQRAELEDLLAYLAGLRGTEER